MSERTPVDLESRLSDALRQYLLHAPDERISEDERLREVCRWLDPLLNRLLKNEDGWGRYRSTDGIAPCAVKRPSKSDFELLALVYWMGDDARGQALEPFSASIHLPDRPDGKMEYTLRFANANLGLGKRPYGASQDFPHVPVTDWMFTFKSPTSDQG